MTITMNRVQAGYCFIALVLIFAVFPISEKAAWADFSGRLDFQVGADPRSVTGEDLNHDGRPDLVIANDWSNSVSVLVGEGAGTYLPAEDYSTGTWPF